MFRCQLCLTSLTTRFTFGGKCTTGVIDPPQIYPTTAERPTAADRLSAKVPVSSRPGP
jgi:hypothetical protein